MLARAELTDGRLIDVEATAFQATGGVFAGGQWGTQYSDRSLLCDPTARHAEHATLRSQSQLGIFQFPFLSVGEPETYLLSTEIGSIVTHTVLLFSGVARNLAEQ